jgi:hypothetical protein
MEINELERLARKAHEAWPHDLTFPEVLSLLAGWKKWGPGMPRTKAGLAWLAGLRTANEALYLEVVAGIPTEGSNPPAESWNPFEREEGR